MELLTKYSPFDAMPLGSNAMVIAIPSHSLARSMLREFANDKNYSIFRYSMWKESKIIRSMIWSGLLLSTGFCLATVIHHIVRK
ncbi:pre-piRNA 3'-exonuclease trimmer-like [Nilaparvata lugens]|uniref:pre-piRNA 3'-exonuclease trimmer-like n=1 Tax=Nilaparvata lugens TaxID=108931 RepID=UPI00193D2097|nr:pre-piRNA 3'-exonuclease trimmer-like [Nilaparvata lugens]